MVSGVRADVALKLFGDDFNTLIPKAQELQSVIAKIDGCRDLTVEQVSGQPILRISLEQDEIARYGISAKSVLDIVESIGSKVVGQVVEGQLRFPLVARLSMMNFVRTRKPSAASCSRRLAANNCRYRVSPTSGESAAPRLSVESGASGGLPFSAMFAEVTSAASSWKLARRSSAQVQLPRSVFRIDWGGQFENMQRAQQRLMIVVPLALALIFGLLYLTYRRISDAVIVFASVPFACVGGIFTLSMREMPLSISSAVGFITLSGVSVLNSMILMSAWRAARDASNRDVAVDTPDHIPIPPEVQVLRSDQTLLR